MEDLNVTSQMYNEGSPPFYFFILGRNTPNQSGFHWDHSEMDKQRSFYLSPIAPNVIVEYDVVPLCGLMYIGSKPSSGKVLLSSKMTFST